VLRLSLQRAILEARQLQTEFCASGFTEPDLSQSVTLDQSMKATVNEGGKAATIQLTDLQGNPVDQLTNRRRTCRKHPKSSWKDAGRDEA